MKNNIPLDHIVYVSGEELGYNEFTINEKDINSKEKVIDFFSRPDEENYYYTKGLESDSYEDTSSGLIVGTLSKNNKNKLKTVDISLDDPDINITNIKNLGEHEFFNCHNTPKKGEIFLTYYFLQKDASYELKINNKNKNICLEIESFWGTAIARNMETEDFEFSALSMGASYNHKVKISFDDGKVIDCDNENENEVIETISQYLINKGVFNK